MARIMTGADTSGVFEVGRGVGPVINSQEGITNWCLGYHRGLDQKLERFGLKEM